MNPSVPLVSGPNGERDDLVALAEIERRWRTSASEERVGRVRFSLWKVDAPLKGRPPRFSPTFYAVVVLGSLGLLALGGWVAGRVRQGEFLAGQIFAVALFVGMYGGMFVAVLVSRRRRSLPFSADPIPTNIPPRSVCCLASVRHRGRSVGWLWFEDDRMRFRGAGFDFDLRREDFRSKGSLLKSLRSGVAPSLRGPKGVSEYQMLLTPGVIASGAFTMDRTLWTDLQPEFETWESGTSTHGPSLFPPIRPVPTTPARLRWTAFVAPSLLMGALLAFAGLVLPMEPTNGRPARSPGELALAGVALGWLWPFVLFIGDRTAKTYAREADRAVREATDTP